MNFIEILMISIGLAADAFAIAICKGISCKKINRKNLLLVGGCFGIFQALMPMIGYTIGVYLKQFIFAIDHYVVFCVFVVIGGNMIYEAFCGEEEKFNSEITIKSLLLPAIATSIDALSVGVTFVFLRVKLFLSVLVIGVVTFLLSMLGVYIGNSFGSKWENKAKFIGGIILIFMGVKSLIAHFL